MAEAGNETTIIAADTHITGQMSFERSARVVGKFEGKVTAKGELQVAETAECKAEVEAQNVVVDGHIEGNVTAREKVQLNAKAKITGDIVAEKLVVAEGASFFGNCAVGPEAAKGGRPAQAEASKPDVVVEAKAPAPPKPAPQPAKR